MDEKEFTETFVVGDEIWCIFPLHFGIPNEIRKCRIIEIHAEHDYVGYRYFSDGNEYAGGAHISSLTNRWHGVFKTEEDAKKCFDERKRAYETDPKLLAEVADARKRWEASMQED